MSLCELFKEMTCLDSSSQVVQVIARHGVYFRRMLYPAVGRNMQHCTSIFCVEVNNIDVINRKTA